MVTHEGKAIRFDENDVREMGRSAMGVKAIDLSDSDTVVAMELVENDSYLLVISELGYGKKTKLDEYKTQNRSGKGLITYSIKDKTGAVVSAKVVDDYDQIMMISNKGTIIRLNTSDVSTMGRSTQGVRLMKFEEDKVVAITKHIEEVETK